MSRRLYTVYRVFIEGTILQPNFDFIFRLYRNVKENEWIWW